MARYIDAEILKRNIRRNLMPNVDIDGTVTVENAERYLLKMIDITATVDVAEVKHGEWHFLPEDPYDESGSPTEAGWYRIITEDGEETTDYFFNKPTLVASGRVSYWKNVKKLIRAWAKMDDDFKGGR